MDLNAATHRGRGGRGSAGLDACRGVGHGASPQAGPGPGGMLAGLDGAREDGGSLVCSKTRRLHGMFHDPKTMLAFEVKPSAFYYHLGCF